MLVSRADLPDEADMYMGARSHMSKIMYGMHANTACVSSQLPQPEPATRVLFRTMSRHGSIDVVSVHPDTANIIFQHLGSQQLLREPLSSRSLAVLDDGNMWGPPNSRNKHHPNRSMIGQLQNVMSMDCLVLMYTCERRSHMHVPGTD